MHPELESLAQLLDEAANLLRTYGVGNWAAWLKTDAERIRRSDFYGVEHLLSAFGGMGSLNDVVLVRSGEMPQEVRNLSNDNAHFESVRTEIYTRATKLAREEQNGREGT